MRQKLHETTENSAESRAESRFRCSEHMTALSDVLMLQLSMFVKRREVHEYTGDSSDLNNLTNHAFYQEAGDGGRHNTTEL